MSIRLDSSGNIILDPAGNIHLGNEGEPCCCPPCDCPGDIWGACIHIAAKGPYTAPAPWNATYRIPEQTRPIMWPIAGETCGVWLTCAVEALIDDEWAFVGLGSVFLELVGSCADGTRQFRLRMLSPGGQSWGPYDKIGGGYTSIGTYADESDVLASCGTLDYYQWSVVYDCDERELGAVTAMGMTSTPPHAWAAASANVMVCVTETGTPPDPPALPDHAEACGYDCYYADWQGSGWSEPYLLPENSGIACPGLCDGTWGWISDPICGAKSCVPYGDAAPTAPEWEPTEEQRQQCEAYWHKIVIWSCNGSTWIAGTITSECGFCATLPADYVAIYNKEPPDDICWGLAINSTNRCLMAVTTTCGPAELDCRESTEETTLDCLASNGNPPSITCGCKRGSCCFYADDKVSCSIVITGTPSGIPNGTYTGTHLPYTGCAEWKAAMPAASGYALGAYETRCVVTYSGTPAVWSITLERYICTDQGGVKVWVLAQTTTHAMTTNDCLGGSNVGGDSVTLEPFEGGGPI